MSGRSSSAARSGRHRAGVVGFLKRYAGVRRYWPGNPGGLGDRRSPKRHPSYSAG